MCDSRAHTEPTNFCRNKLARKTCLRHPIKIQEGTKTVRFKRTLGNNIKRYRNHFVASSRCRVTYNDIPTARPDSPVFFRGSSVTDLRFIPSVAGEYHGYYWLCKSKCIMVNFNLHLGCVPDHTGPEVV